MGIAYLLLQPERVRSGLNGRDKSPNLQISRKTESENHIIWDADLPFAKKDVYLHSLRE